MAISFPYTFQPSTTIASAEVNANFTAVSTAALVKTGDTMTGDLKFTDALYDIGKSGATRPRDGFFSRNVVIGGTLGVVGITTLAATVVQGNLTFTDATYDIGATGATRPRDIFLSRNAVIGGVITAAAQPRASAYNNTTQSHGTSGTYITATFNAEDYDVGTMHDTGSNTSRITIPSGGDGLYHCIGTIVFAANATGERAAKFQKNGSDAAVPQVITSAVGAGNATCVQVSAYLPLVAGDYIEVQGYQTSTGALNMGSATRNSANTLQVSKVW